MCQIISSLRRIHIDIIKYGDHAENENYVRVHVTIN